MLLSSLDFCDFGCVDVLGSSEAIARETSKRKIRHQQLTGIIFFGNLKRIIFSIDRQMREKPVFMAHQPAKKIAFEDGFLFNAADNCKKFHSCLISNQKALANNVTLRPMCVIYFEVSVSVICSLQVTIREYKGRKFRYPMGTRKSDPKIIVCSSIT